MTGYAMNTVQWLEQARILNAKVGSPKKPNLLWKLHFDKLSAVPWGVQLVSGFLACMVGVFLLAWTGAHQGETCCPSKVVFWSFFTGILMFLLPVSFLSAAFSTEPALQLLGGVILGVLALGHVVCLIIGWVWVFGTDIDGDCKDSGDEIYIVAVVWNVLALVGLVVVFIVVVVGVFQHHRRANRQQPERELVWFGI